MQHVKINFPVSDEFLEKQRSIAAASPRRRTLNIICNEDQPIQALINTFCYGSYVRPHKHHVEEVFESVDGDFRIVTFDNKGRVKGVRKVFKKKVVAVPPETWHTIFCVSEYGTVFETKVGYYDQVKDKIFAEWAPKEDSPGAAAYFAKLSKNV